MKQGRPTKKVANLKCFIEQWQEFTDDTQALVEFNDEDAIYVRGSLHWDSPSLNETYGLAANILQEEMQCT